MKTLPINNSTYHNNFKGLWDYGDRIIIDAGPFVIKTQQLDYYFPFLNEPLEEINAALYFRNFENSWGYAEDGQIEIHNNYAQQGKTLPFNKEEYNAYKNFYGKVMPKAIKKVEDGLKVFGLNKYLNRGFVYNIKKFMHNIKR